MTIATLGIDLGKSVFHLVGQDAQGSTVLRRRMTRRQLIILTATLPVCRIGMEACCGPLPWPDPGRAGSPCAADAGAVCAALR